MARSSAFAAFLLRLVQSGTMQLNVPERRRRSRVSTMILCELSVVGAPIELARVRDLSEMGVKIAIPQTLLLGDRVRVRLPGGCDWVVARVAWCAQGVAGLAFVRAIDLPHVSGASRHHEETALFPRAAVGRMGR